VARSTTQGRLYLRATTARFDEALLAGRYQGIPENVQWVQLFTFRRITACLGDPEAEQMAVRAGQPPLIGVGCIGGSIEAGETPLQALHREAMEEITCSIELRSARLTADVSPSGIQILSNLDVEGVRPAMVWEVTNTSYIPGSKVAVFLGRVTGDAQPGDLPAIMLTEPELISLIGSKSISIDEAKDAGAEFRTNIELPTDGRLILANTLQRLQTLKTTHNALFDEFLLA
jgi:hypothetical protein